MNTHEMLPFLETLTEEECESLLYVNPQIKFFFEVSLPAALKQKKSLGHILLVCPDKNILRHFIAMLDLKTSELETRAVPGKPSKLKPGDWCAAITNLSDSSLLVLLEDKLVLSNETQNILSAAITDYVLNITLGKGPSAQTMRLEVPTFTCVTCVEQISPSVSALLPAFEYAIIVEKDSMPSLCKAFIKETSKVPIDEDACDLVARLSEYNLHEASKLLSRIHEYCQRKEASVNITKAVVEEISVLLGKGNPCPELMSSDLYCVLADIRSSLKTIQKDVHEIRKSLEKFLEQNEKRPLD